MALDAGIDTSEANPAARLQIAMMLAFAEWERQTVRERSIAGQIRAREAGKIIGRAEALTESAKPDIRLLHQQGQSATRLARTTALRALPYTKQSPAAKPENTSMAHCAITTA